MQALLKIPLMIGRLTADSCTLRIKKMCLTIILPSFHPNPISVIKNQPQ